MEERLREFLQGMLHKLDINSHKRTPEITDVPGMTDMLIGELEEFTEQFETNKHDVNTLIELFDVANFAFLIFLALRNQGHADWRNVPGETPKAMTLLDAQKAALVASKGKPGFGYFMEMGLGKTLVSYEDFLREVEAGTVKRKVVVCPNSFKGGWRDEAVKWDLGVHVHVYNSGNDNDNSAFLRRSFDKPPVLIVNYEAIRSQKTIDYIMAFINGRDSWITFDESIQLKTHDSQQTRAAIALSKYFKFRRILTGKPITQGPHDLWAQMRVLGQLDGKNYYAFKTAFCRMGGFKMKQVIGAQNEELLGNLISPHVFRATKEEWTDLPPKLYSQREYELSPNMRRMYKQMENEFVLWLEDGDNVSVEAAITKYIKLAQISSGFIIREDGSVEELVAPMDNPRVRLLKEIIEREVSGKVVVAYHHRSTLNILREVLRDGNPAVIQGGLTEDAIRFEKDKFNNMPECRVLLAQIKASKYGHTLLGGSEPENRCSTMIFFENTYSLDDRSQVEDRIHRHGQVSDSVLYIDMFGTSLDYRVNHALQRKESIFQAIFNKSASLSQTPYQI
jgi:SNF2 family DNA or RNA helicase